MSASMPANGPVEVKGGEPDFGTYHRTTRGRSAKTRERVKALFTDAFESLPFSPDDRLRILDVGCGLGFLSCVCAEFYPNSSVTGFDTFEHTSLKGSSLEKAGENAKILGFSDRVIFQKADFFRSDYRDERFDLLVSNLVFHNFGKRRFEGYERLARWATPRSYVVLGDLFLHYRTDIRSISSVFGGFERIPGSAMGFAYRVLVLSDPKPSTPEAKPGET